jgi:hypothetical protein
LALNVRIAHVNARNISGSSSDVAPLDVDEVVRDWKAAR